MYTDPQPDPQPDPHIYIYLYIYIFHLFVFNVHMIENVSLVYLILIKIDLEYSIIDVVYNIIIY